MTIKSKRLKYHPVEHRPYVARPVPFEVLTGQVTTLHYDRQGAEDEVRWQRKQYGREAEIVTTPGQP
jgi:hypothetical protein